MDTEFSVLLARLIPRLETEAGVSVKQDIAIATDLTLGIFRIVSEECIKACLFPEEFLGSMRNAIPSLGVFFSGTSLGQVL